MARAMRNNVHRAGAGAAVLIAGITMFGCATNEPTDDPLKHTKKLVTEGHVSLYNNGAFQVPQTSIRLIPPGPSAIEFVTELMGLRARQSFLLALTRAREALTILAEGTTISYHMAQGVHHATDTLTDEIAKATRENSTLLAYRSWADAKGIVGKTWDFPKRRPQT